MNLVRTVYKRVPSTESQGRVHTSTATVVVMPEAEEVEIELEDKDIRVDIYHASGAGGQHVNKNCICRTFNSLANRNCCCNAR